MISSTGFLSATIIYRNLSFIIVGPLACLARLPVVQNTIEFLNPTGKRETGKPFLRCLAFRQAQRIGTKFFDLFGKFGRIFGEQRAFAGGKIIHPGPFASDTDGVQNLAGLGHSPFGHQVAGIKMTFPLQAADHTGTVGAFFHGPQDMDDINLAGTGDSHDFNVRRVIQSHRTFQVRGCVTSEIAAECNNNRLKILAHNFLSRNEMPKLPKSA